MLKDLVTILEGLTAAPDQGGSIEFVDNGSNNDPSSYVISNSSYTAADGRGALTVHRAQLELLYLHMMVSHQLLFMRFWK